MFGTACEISQHGSEVILRRLESDFIAAARRRYGETEWRHAERAGAAMPFHEAIGFALTETEREFGSLNAASASRI